MADITDTPSENSPAPDDTSGSKPATPTPVTGGVPPAQAPPPPDDLRYNEPPDSAFVTGEVHPMKRGTYISLLVWLIFCNIGAVLLLIHTIPLLDCTLRHEQNQAKPESRTTTASTVAQTSTANVSTANVSTATIAQSQSDNDCPECKGVYNPMSITKSLQAVLFIALLAGCLGGALHGLASILDYRGERRLFASWTLWYIGQPIQGAITAVIFIVILQAGLLTGMSGSTSLNPVGVIAIALLVGMTADDATSRLGVVFTTLFSTPKRSGLLSPGDVQPLNLEKLKKQMANIEKQIEETEKIAKTGTGEEKQEAEQKLQDLNKEKASIYQTMKSYIPPKPEKG